MPGDAAPRTPSARSCDAVGNRIRRLCAINTKTCHWTWHLVCFTYLRFIFLGCILILSSHRLFDLNNRSRILFTKTVHALRVARACGLSRALRLHLPNNSEVVEVTNSFSHLTSHTPHYPYYLLLDSPPVGQGLLIHEVSRSHTTTHHSR